MLLRFLQRFAARAARWVPALMKNLIFVIRPTEAHRHRKLMQHPGWLLIIIGLLIAESASSG